MKPLKKTPISGFAKKAADLCLDALLPPRCIVTGEIVDRQGAVSAQAWQALVFITDPLCRRCGIPFAFEAGEELLCAACLKREPFYDRARAALVYDDASRDMILRFKHADQIHAIHSFLPWMLRAGADILPGADMVMPVPLHRWRLLKRRYNQAALIAKIISKNSYIEFVPDILVRRRATPSQGHKSALERRKNVRRAFTLHPRRAASVAGKRIVLIDDVLTTGATVSECAKTLKKAGALSVDVLALARVVRPGSE